MPCFLSLEKPLVIVDEPGHCDGSVFDRVDESIIHGSPDAALDWCLLLCFHGCGMFDDRWDECSV